MHIKKCQFVSAFVRQYYSWNRKSIIYKFYEHKSNCDVKKEAHKILDRRLGHLGGIMFLPTHSHGSL